MDWTFILSPDCEGVYSVSYPFEPHHASCIVTMPQPYPEQLGDEPAELLDDEPGLDSIEALMVELPDKLDRAIAGAARLAWHWLIQALKAMPPSIPFCKPPDWKVRPKRTEDKSERDRFYAGSRWRRLRLAYLAENPLCSPCERKGLEVAATIVHHKVERLADPELAYDWDNLESSCSPCHTAHHKRRQQ